MWSGFGELPFFLLLGQTCPDASRFPTTRPIYPLLLCRDVDQSREVRETRDVESLRQDIQPLVVELLIYHEDTCVH